ncbi:MAG: hypothetical protein ABIK61_04710 [candidate division WOR-3 bacterium]
MIICENLWSLWLKDSGFRVEHGMTFFFRAFLLSCKGVAMLHRPFG